MTLDEEKAEIKTTINVIEDEIELYNDPISGFKEIDTAAIIHILEDCKRSLQKIIE